MCCGLVLLPVMMAFTPQLPHPCISTPVAGFSNTVLLLRNVFVSPVLRSAKIVCCNLTLLLLQRVLGLLLWEGEGRQLHIWGIVFCLAMVAARPQLPHLCVLSLPLSLGSASVCADDSGQNVESTTLILRAAECVHCFLTFLPPKSFGPAMISRLCHSPFLPSLFAQTCLPSDVSMQGSPRHVCVLSREGVLC